MSYERMRHLLAVAIDPSEDEDHEWCDETSGGAHVFDRGAFEADVEAFLRSAPALTESDPTWTPEWEPDL